MRLKQGSLHGPATWWRSVSVLESASWMLRQVVVSIGGWKSTSTARAGTNGQPSLTCAYWLDSLVNVTWLSQKCLSVCSWWRKRHCQLQLANDAHAHTSSCRSSRVNEGWGHSLKLWMRKPDIVLPRSQTLPPTFVQSVITRWKNAFREFHWHAK